MTMDIFRAILGAFQTQPAVVQPQLNKQIVTLSDTLPFTANRYAEISIPNVGYITRMLLHIVLTVSTGTSVTYNQDALFRIIKALEIKSPRKTFVQLTDGRLLYVKEIFDTKGHVQLPDLPGANQSNVKVEYYITIHFGFNPDDPFDTSMLIPAAEVDELKLRILWGDNSDLGSGVTINDGTVYITLYRVMNNPGGYVLPAWQTYDIDITATSYFGQNVFKLQGYGTCYDIIPIILDTNDNRSDSVINKFRIYIPELQASPMEITDKAWKKQVAQKYKIDPSLLVGIREVDPVQIFEQTINLDALRYALYKIEFDYTATANGKVRHFILAYQ